MNKKIFYLLALLVSLSLCVFTACGDDDDEEQPNDYAKEIAGTYGGKLSIPGLLGEAQLDNNILVAKTADNKVKLSLNTLSLPIGENGATTTIDNIAVENITVSKSGNIYKLDQTVQTITIKIGGVLEIPAKVTVSGTVENNAMQLSIKVEDIDIPNLSITFTGTKK